MYIIAVLTLLPKKKEDLSYYFATNVPIAYFLGNQFRNFM